MNDILFQEKAYQRLMMNFTLFSEAREEYTRDQNSRAISNLKDLLFALRTSKDRLDSSAFKVTCIKLQPHLRNLHHAWLNEMMYDVIEDDSERLDPDTYLRFIHTCEALIIELDNTSDW